MSWYNTSFGVRNSNSFKWKVMCALFKVEIINLGNILTTFSWTSLPISCKLGTKKKTLGFGNSSLDTWNNIHYLKGRKWQNRQKTLATIGKKPLQNHLVSFSKFWHRATFGKGNYSLYYFDQNSYWSPFIFRTKCWYIKTVYCWDMLLRWVMMVVGAICQQGFKRKGKRVTNRLWPGIAIVCGGEGVAQKRARGLGVS